VGRTLAATGFEVSRGSPQVSRGDDIASLAWFEVSRGDEAASLGWFQVSRGDEKASLGWFEVSRGDQAASLAWFEVSPGDEEASLAWFEVSRGDQKASLGCLEAVEAVARGQSRALLVMATGTGKTYTAFQIIWRLWKSGAKKRILFLADRNILIDQTMVNDFRPFKGAMDKLSPHAKGVEVVDGQGKTTLEDVDLAVHRTTKQVNKPPSAGTRFATRRVAN
jgi:hypothetical protein